MISRGPLTIEASCPCLWRKVEHNATEELLNGLEAAIYEHLAAPRTGQGFRAVTEHVVSMTITTRRTYTAAVNVAP